MASADEVPVEPSNPVTYRAVDRPDREPARLEQSRVVPRQPPANTPVVPRFRIKIAPETRNIEQSISPARVKSWATSLVCHILLLVLLALVFFPPVARPGRAFDTSLSAGDLFGSDLGQQLTGAQGLDEPLAMPYSPEDIVVQTFRQDALTESQPLEPSLVIPERRVDTAPDASARGGGVDLTGAGQAGQGDGFGVAKFGLGGKESINNVEVKVGNPQFTLLWDSAADLDLHVLEPGGSHIYWENRHGANGGELDVDNVTGRGPENVFWGGGLNQGNGPPGEYRWYVHYYGGLYGNLPTKWRVRVKYEGTYKVFEGKLNGIGQRTKTWSFKIDKSESHPDRPTAEATGNDDRKNGERPQALRGEPTAFESPSSMLSGGPGRTRPGTEQEVVDDSSPDQPKSSPARRQRPAQANEPKPGEETPAPKRRPVYERDSTGWLVVKPPDAAFHFLMPQEPAEETRILENRPDEPEIRSWVLNRGEGEFVVALTQLKNSDSRGESTSVILDREARAQVAEAGGTEATTTNVTKGQIQERTLRFKVPEKLVAGGGFSRMRLLVTSGQLYKVSITGTEEFVDSPDSRRFLESFQVGVETPGPAKK